LLHRPNKAVIVESFGKVLAIAMLSRFLGLFGLARLNRLRDASAKADESKARTTDLTARLETARQETERWKQKNQDTETRLAAASKEIERWKHKHTGYLAKLSQLERAEQRTKLAHEHLLALETKLDIIEGAITVLDRRTRDQMTTPDPLEPEQTTDSPRE
jgi:DNA repair exonuclease SbcCD ATPase subunit